MLAYAAHESSLDAVKSNRDLARYVQGFGRDGDVGFVAETKQNQVIGAAWLRLWTDSNKGYGYVSNEIPELAIAVHPNYRGQGIGTRLLNQLLNHASSQLLSVSLSVRADNPALRLYERLGFMLVPGSEITNREGTQSFSMIYRFTQPNAQILTA